ncbi:hypothetical protein P5673_010337 [Acropora cervicornis]|uniref:Uncharacterized protein n=1 Tax=Acropora cervicornis TaxID=6130 RepID=A0AAD9V9R5_ACRCE|nr:hypothetical protein P5673_010337 [Acropora cervicornis]
MTASSMRITLDLTQNYSNTKHNT